MSTFPAWPSGHLGDRHPDVRSRRIRELLLVGASAVIPLVLALAISVQVAHPSFLLLFGVTGGGLILVALVTSERYAMSLALIVLYLGLLEGPVKLGSGGHEAASVLRNVLIFAVSLGAILRLLVKRERLALPPLSVWPLAFTALALVEAFNPNTHGIVKVLGGFRQQLEWIPFFFFGYVIMRSKKSFRRLFLILGVLALANGAVSTYQTRLSPEQLASWGPGYKELVFGTNGLSGRTYESEGIARVRPPALGTDAGFGGAVGVVALPGVLALLATGRLRRRWPVLLLTMGALGGVVTGLGRLQVIGAVFSLLAFTLLSFSTGRRVARPLIALMGVVVLALPLGAVFVSLEGGGTFSRYAEIAPGNVGAARDTKAGELEHIPAQATVAPFGVGLGTVGAAAGFGGKQAGLLEGHGAGAETQLNLILDELGLPGLLLWVGLTIRLLVLALPRLRGIPDFELRLYLAAIFSSFIAFTVMGFSGPTMTSAVLGPFFWFAAGIAAYWFAGPGRLLGRDEAKAMDLAGV